MSNSSSAGEVSITAIDDLVKSYLAKPTNGLSGLAISAINKDGKLIYNKALGKRSLDPANEGVMTMDTVCRIGTHIPLPLSKGLEALKIFFGLKASQTKLMTAVAVMQCVGRGQIGLDDPVGKVCRELAEPMIVEAFEENGTPKMLRAESELTLRYSYPTLHPSLVRWMKATGNSGNFMSANIEEDARHPLVFEPGSSWMYGVGVDWAGQVVERLDDYTLAEFVEQNIFTPLGMVDTTFRPALRADLNSRTVGTCYQYPDGSLARGAHPLAVPAPSELGGSGCYSTCQDYIKFLTALLQNGGDILKKESVDEIFKPQLSDSANAALQSYKHLFTRRSVSQLETA
ncbi:hypothetical protein FRB97_002544 [Tulasnella sp. 331]|nr:hypothetical protein FRB97_002544 [Tulasnella sp. 331]KAG8884478.1 hypothetical protein FRB98_002377 [Tulasnella sp. 332]